MAKRAVSKGIKWRPLEDEIKQKRLGEVLESWEGTKYFPGQQCKGVGVDCVRFVCGVFDEILGVKTPISTLPPDASVHSPEKALERAEIILSLYPGEEVNEGFVQPGDVLITGPVNGGPGHVMVVGHLKNVAFHAAPPRVQRTGVVAMYMFGHKVFNIFRPDIYKRSEVS